MESTAKTDNMQEKVYCDVPIEYHADDFGLFPTQSQRILECHYHGILNGTSVMPNSTYLNTCMELLHPVKREIALTVHLNIIEGCSICSHEEIPLLTDQNGVFRISFGKLLLGSFLPGRNAYRKQLKRELKAQIYAILPYLEEGMPLRLDGHAHYHMLPVVFDALMDVIQEEKLKVSYIRIPREYPSLYLRHWRELRDFSAINLLKVLILNILAGRNQKKYRDILGHMEQKVFLGVFLSGRMYWENVMPVLQDAIELARNQGKGLEILAHPGGVYEEDDIRELTYPEDIDFLTSGYRRKEASLFMRNGSKEAEK